MLEGLDSYLDPWAAKAWHHFRAKQHLAIAKFVAWKVLNEYSTVTFSSVLEFMQTHDNLRPQEISDLRFAAMIVQSTNL